MKQSDKEALKEALRVIGVTAALIFAAAIIALVALVVMQYRPIAAAAISIVFALILGGVIIFFVER